MVYEPYGLSVGNALISILLQVALNRGVSRYQEKVFQASQNCKTEHYFLTLQYRHVADEKNVVLEELDGYIVAEKDGRLLVCRLAEEQHIKEFSQA